MQRYFIKLAYNGQAYHGWQSQDNAHTVQQELEHCLSVRLRQQIRLTGCGRTDTGVHARNFYAHFDLADAYDQLTTTDFVDKLNVFLPKDIVVFGIEAVDAFAHSRFDAMWRSYHYEISRQKDPFSLDGTYYLYGPLDIEAMNRAAASLLQYTDFTSFSKLHSQTRTNECIIKEAYWIETGNNLVFKITANRFLRNMVRAIVGTLIEVGKGKIDQSGFVAIIEAHDRSKAGFSVPAQGLYLQDVVYPDGMVSI